LAHAVIGCAITVHRALGPGLLESAYRRCAQCELTQRGIKFRAEVPLPLLYNGVVIDCAYRVDLIIEDELLVEFKSVDRVLPYPSHAAADVSKAHRSSPRPLDQLQRVQVG
jgi:GxxExxY protein